MVSLLNPRRCRDPLNRLVTAWRLFGSAAASRRRDAKTVVGASNPADYPGVVRSVLARNPICPPANDAEHGGRPASGLVPQNSPDFLRCFGAGKKGVVGACDFSAITCGHRYGKSPAEVRGAANRNALLCGLNGQSRALGSRVNKGKHKAGAARSPGSHTHTILALEFSVSRLPPLVYDNLTGCDLGWVRHQGS